MKMAHGIVLAVVITACAPLALASLRFGLGRWTTEEEVDFAITRVSEAVGRLRAMSPV